MVCIFDCDYGKRKKSKLFISIVKHVGVLQALAYILLFANPLSINADTENLTITPYAGYRDGGDFKDAVSDTRLDIDESGTLGLIFGWEVKDGQLEISYSRQASELTGRSSASPDALVDVDITNLLFAGKSILDPDIGSYISVLLGLTHIDIDSDELDSDIRPVFGFGGGIDRPIGDNLGFRLGLRGIVTFLDDNEDEFCDSSSNCPILIDDNALVQWEIFTGLSIRF